MSRILPASIAALALFAGLAVQAQEHGHSHDSGKAMAVSGPDARQRVDFPPAMRDHTLANMRDHLLALSEILATIAQGQYAQAGEIARARLGMESPSAAGCQGGEAAGISRAPQAADMDHRMAGFMPEGMRGLGLEMHRAASLFADEAAKADASGNAQPAMAALAQLSRQCAACHSAWRLH